MVLLNYVDRGAIGIAAPKLKDELMLSATAFGIAVSAFFWVYAPVAVRGRLAVGSLLRLSDDRGGARGVGARAPCSPGFAGGLAMLVALRIMLGIGESIAFPGSFEDHRPPCRRRKARDCQQRGRRRLALGRRLAPSPAA